MLCGCRLWLPDLCVLLLFVCVRCRCYVVRSCLCVSVVWFGAACVSVVFAAMCACPLFCVSCFFCFCVCVWCVCFGCSFSLFCVRVCRLCCVCLLCGSSRGVCCFVVCVVLCVGCVVFAFAAVVD